MEHLDCPEPIVHVAFSDIEQLEELTEQKMQF